MLEIIKWDDIDCVARIKINKEPPTLKFEVFEIVGRYENKKNGEFTEPLYEKKVVSDYTEQTEYLDEEQTEDLDEAQTLVSGLIKWDACSHVYFGDEDGYIHICGGRNWFCFQEAIKRIWEIAIKELPLEHSKDMFDLELFNK